MHLTRGTAFLGTIPIVNPIGGVAVLLDLDDDIAGAEGVEPAARQKNRVAGFHFKKVQMLLDASILEGLLELRGSGSFFKARVDPRFRRTIGNEPEFRFRFAAEFFGDAFRRVNLKRQILLRVEELAQDGEAWSVGNFAENFVAMLRPELVQSRSAQWSFVHDALRLRPIDD